MQTAPSWAQVRKLHTRDLTRLSQVQVADYLKRSDIIFIPIGAVETNGIMPSDRDYVSPLAYAMTMADELDALVHAWIDLVLSGHHDDRPGNREYFSVTGSRFSEVDGAVAIAAGIPAAGLPLVGPGAGTVDRRHAGPRILR